MCAGGARLQVSTCGSALRSISSRLQHRYPTSLRDRTPCRGRCRGRPSCPKCRIPLKRCGLALPVSSRFSRACIHKQRPGGSSHFALYRCTRSLRSHARRRSQANRDALIVERSARELRLTEATSAGNTNEHPCLMMSLSAV